MTAVATASLLAGPARGEVVDAAAGGFTVSSSAEVAVAPEAAFRQLLDIGAWWSPDHTWSGDATNLSIDPRPGGCFCERLPGGGVQHLEVVFVQPPTTLRLRGGLGPLQAMAVQGSMTWAIAPLESGARVTLTYTVVGYSPNGLEGLAPVVDRVLTEQLGSLAQSLDGDADSGPPAP